LGLDALRAFLRRHRRIALDTSVFIYQLEPNRKYSPFTNIVFAWLERPNSSGITSTITMTELLVQPYRNRDQQRVDVSYALLSTYPNLGGRHSRTGLSLVTLFLAGWFIDPQILRRRP